MLTNSQLRKLSFLNKKIKECDLCERICNNGKAFPFFSRSSKYLMMAEAPGEEEVQKDKQTPLVGTSGVRLFNELSKHKLKFKRKDFLILNTIQCRPVVNGKNGKPTKSEIENCKIFTSRFIEVFEPKVILALGNYANKYFFEDDWEGISIENGRVRVLESGIKVIPCFHPAAILYSPEKFSHFLFALKKFKQETLKAERMK